MVDISNAWISPHYLYEHIDLETSSIDDRVAILEDRIRGYFTTPARLLSNIYENSILIVFLSIFACVELIEVFYRGKSSKHRSQEFFKSGFKRIFNPMAPEHIPKDQFESNLDKALDEIYYQARCGLIHTGTTRSKVIIRKDLNAPVAIQFDALKGEVLQIELNPNWSLVALDVFISEYCRDLRNSQNEELRSKFDEAWQALRSEG